MEIYIIDIWLEKLRRGWSLDDVPNEEIKKALIGVGDKSVSYWKCQTVGAENAQAQVDINI